MLRRLAAAFLALTLATAALAEDSDCEITYENSSGSNLKGDASLWKGNTLQIGDTTYTDANGGTYKFTLDNDTTLVIQADESKECDIVAFITNEAENAALKSEVKATGSDGTTKCDEDNENNFKKKYGCSCSGDNGAHHAKITMTCDGNS
jgi:hypothetical protein